MQSPNYTSDPNELDAGGVHTNSGVNNKAAFLMVDGGTFNGRTVTRLGATETEAIDDVARIYYEVNNNMLTSAADYQDLFNALQQACANLVGSAGITSADCAEVTDALLAVEMNQLPQAAPNPEAPEPSCASQAPRTLFFDNAESFPDANVNWSPQPGWFYEGLYATSGDFHYVAEDRPTIGDYSLTMNNSIAIPAETFLRFDHAYGFEDDGGGTYDGGVLEYSTDNGASWNDAGSLFTHQGYNGQVTPGSGNPLSGRGAFVAESNGYISSLANLGSLAGQNVRFRFRVGTDATEGDYGWFLDDIHVYACSPVSTGGGGPTVSLNLDGPRVINVNRRGVFVFRFRATPGSRGTAVFRTVRRVKVSARRRVTFARRRFTTPSSGRVRLRVRLSRRNVRVLRRNRRRALTRVSVTATGPAGGRASGARNIVLRLRRR
jgi:hypothetical protein